MLKEYRFKHHHVRLKLGDSFRHWLFRTLRIGFAAQCHLQFVTQKKNRVAFPRICTTFEAFVRNLLGSCLHSLSHFNGPLSQNFTK